MEFSHIERSNVGVIEADIDPERERNELETVAVYVSNSRPWI